MSSHVLFYIFLHIIILYTNTAVSEQKDGNFVVCCTDVNAFIYPMQYNYYDFNGYRMSDRKCYEYTQERQRLINLQRETSGNIECNNGKCEYYNVVSIVYGTDAKYDEFPHMALIGWEKADGSGFDWNCGGSLISEYYILTAAHCLFSSNTEYKSEYPSMIRLGDSVPIEITIANYTVHPDYKPPKKYNDIALIKLAKPVNFTLYIRPACLGNHPTIVGGVATGIGWGLTSEGGEKAQRLQKAELNLVPQDECKKIHSIQRSIPDGIVESQICGGTQVGRGDACQGDSGGPIHLKDDKNNGIFHVIGVTSFGAGCGTSKGGVYTKVSHYVDWIERIVWNLQ